MNIGGIIRGASESVSGAIRAEGAKKASKKEEKAYQRAFELYGQLREEAGVTRKAIDPFSEYRGEAAKRLRDITLGDPQAYLAQDPGYQFRLQEGQRATQRAMGARGAGVTSGATMAALQERGQGLASQEYAASVNRLMELGGGFASVGVAGGQAYGQMTQAGIEGQAQAMIGKGFAQSRGIAGYFEGHAQANAAAGRGVASIWEMPGMGGGGGGGGGMGGGMSGGGGMMGGMMGGMGSMMGGMGG